MKSENLQKILHPPVKLPIGPSQTIERSIKGNHGVELGGAGEVFMDEVRCRTLSGDIVKEVADDVTPPPLRARAGALL